jgi:hypothetical protein
LNKLVITKLHDSTKEAVRRTTLSKTRARNDKGELRTLYKINASSEKFDLEFAKAFSLSVAKARKQMRRSKKPAAGADQAD